jgi:hypothetical protein
LILQSSESGGDSRSAGAGWRRRADRLLALAHQKAQVRTAVRQDRNCGRGRPSRQTAAYIRRAQGAKWSIPAELSKYATCKSAPDWFYLGDALAMPDATVIDQYAVNPDLSVSSGRRTRQAVNAVLALVCVDHSCVGDRAVNPTGFWYYAASFGITLSTNRKNRLFRAPDLNLRSVAIAPHGEHGEPDYRAVARNALHRFSYLSRATILVRKSTCIPGTIVPAQCSTPLALFLHFIMLLPTDMRPTVRFPPVACFRGASATAGRGEYRSLSY